MTGQISKNAADKRQLSRALLVSSAVVLAAYLWTRATSTSHVMAREILPTTITPAHYAVSLTPDLDAFTFAGSVDITVKVHNQTRIVKINTNELNFTGATISYLDKKTEESFKTSSVSFDEKLEQSTLHFDKDIAANTAVVLHIDFTGTLNDKMAGFYRSGYNDPDGNKKFMAVTQFEATDARRCFPCWDEPSLKATFDITLNVASYMTALSNMNVVREEPYTKKSGYKSVVFARTPIMSTYLVAFAVGELDFIETITSPKSEALPAPVKVRVYTTKGQSAQGKFALDCAARTLEYFSKVFGEPYPLPKMDMIAVPDFSAGAMENWGLVTYRTVYLLFDEKTSSAISKERIAYVVAHELAHQWFGNLVTMQWWDELWLNEGFATWVGWLAVDNLFPEWDIWTKFVLDDMGSALSLDALKNSHPIQVPVQSPSEITQIFDAISYSKGASVIRMLSSWLTVDTFLEGVRRYIRKFRYANASTDDLWAALSDASNVDVGSFMQLWTKEVGYPVLRIEHITDHEIKVAQSRFLSSGNISTDEDKTVWWCPLAIFTGDQKTANEINKTAILKSRSDTFTIPTPIKPLAVDFYKLNERQANIYRVLYPAKDLEKIGMAIAHGNLLHTTDRVGLISDTFALAVAGICSTVDGLNLLKYFEKESAYVAMSQVATRINAIQTVWASEPQEVKDRLHAFARQIFSKTAARLSFEYPEGEGHLEGMLRTLAVGMAGLNGDQKVVTEAQERFAKFIKGDQSAIHPNLRHNVYSIVLKYGGRTEYEHVKNIWESNIAMDQKLAALNALGQIEDESILNEILLYTLDEKNVRPQDFVYPLGSVADNPLGRRLAWNFVVKNWDLLNKRFNTTLSLLSRCVTITSDWASEEFATELEQFFKGKDTKNIDRALKQTLEKIRQQAAWLQRDRATVAEWLVGHVKI